MTFPWRSGSAVGSDMGTSLRPTPRAARQKRGGVVTCKRTFVAPGFLGGCRSRLCRHTGPAASHAPLPRWTSSRGRLAR